MILKEPKKKHDKTEIRDWDEVPINLSLLTLHWELYLRISRVFVFTIRHHL